MQNISKNIYKTETVNVTCLISIVLKNELRKAELQQYLSDKIF
jgi:hypothetical protein